MEACPGKVAVKITVGWLYVAAKPGMLSDGGVAEEDAVVQTLWVSRRRSLRSCNGMSAPHEA